MFVALDSLCPGGFEFLLAAFGGAQFFSPLGFGLIAFGRLFLEFGLDAIELGGVSGQAVGDFPGAFAGVAGGLLFALQALLQFVMFLAQEREFFLEFFVLFHR